MHRILILLIAGLGLAGCGTAPEQPVTTGDSSTLEVMTFNIRYGNADDGANSWEFRQPLAREVIAMHSPDIMGMQEALRGQLDLIREWFPEYAELGVSRFGNTDNEYCAILYKRDRFEVLASGNFWLSDTPEIPSATWGNKHLRLCTWARFLDKESGQTFYHYNTHLDHAVQLARMNGAKQLAEVIAGRTHPDPIFLTGDFNADEDNPAVTYLKGAEVEGEVSPVSLQDTFRVLFPDVAEAGTFNHYNGRRDGPKIDYIFVTPDVETLEAEIITHARDGVYPSDHYPVRARIRLVD